MTPAEYRRLTRAQLLGRKVRTLRTMENRSGVISAGTVATIVDKASGLALRVDACSCCGFQPSISKVDPSYVELLP